VVLLGTVVVPLGTVVVVFGPVVEVFGPVVVPFGAGPRRNEDTFVTFPCRRSDVGCRGGRSVLVHRMSAMWW
jgi:hypothetical protein